MELVAKAGNCLISISDLSCISLLTRLTGHIKSRHIEGIELFILDNTLFSSISEKCSGSEWNGLEEYFYQMKEKLFYILQKCSKLTGRYP